MWRGSGEARASKEQVQEEQVQEEQVQEEQVQEEQVACARACVRPSVRPCMMMACLGLLIPCMRGSHREEVVLHLPSRVVIYLEALAEERDLFGSGHLVHCHNRDESAGEVEA